MEAVKGRKEQLIGELSDLRRRIGILQAELNGIYGASCGNNRDGGADGEIPALSARETEVLNWIRQGKSTWDISGILGISERTVKFHVGNIMRKLDAVSRAQAVSIAMERGLLDLSRADDRNGLTRLAAPRFS